MRAETRHQLKEDRFSKATLEAAEKTVHWSQEHQSKLIAAAVAVAVIAAIAIGGWYYISAQDEKASLELTGAVRTLETPLRPAGTPEQPGYPSFDSTTARATAARREFQAIADKYPQTRSGKMARYFVGLTAAQLGDNATAEHDLQEAANSSDSNLASLGKMALASVYAAEGKDPQAVDLYQQLIDRPTEVVAKVTAQFQLASFYESRHKTDDARKIYTQVQKENAPSKENPSSEAAQLAQRKLAELK
ncbi:MAG: tetratricopeptide repeat protein [Terriglobales bacterium]